MNKNTTSNSHRSQVNNRSVAEASGSPGLVWYKKVEKRNPGGSFGTELTKPGQSDKHKNTQMDTPTPNTRLVSQSLLKILNKYPFLRTSKDDRISKVNTHASQIT